MTNAEKFGNIFGLYATELWSMPEQDFLKWLNTDIPDKNVGDTISRQVAIDTEGLDEQIRCEMCRNPMHTDRGCDGNCKYDEKLYERIMQILGERIKLLPSAQPEREKGKWTKDCACEICGFKPWYERDIHTLSFCPNCGADMR